MEDIGAFPQHHHYDTEHDEAEDDDEGNVTPRVAGLAETKDGVALGTVVGELSEAREKVRL